MQKLLRLVHPNRGLDDGAPVALAMQFPEMLDGANRPFMCTVLFLQLIDYSKKPVSDQLKAKDRFNTCISEAIEDIEVNDRIILDTGDGVIVNFLGDPENALFVAMNLSRAFAFPLEGESRIEVRIGINLGPVRLVRDINAQPNIIGDGINVAERVMSFAHPAQVLVSRSYYETVARISEEYAELFVYQGSRTDMHVREHEIYAVASSGGEAFDLATRRHRTRRSSRPAVIERAESGQTAPAKPLKAWLNNRALAYGAAGMSAAILLSALVFYALETREKPAVTKVANPASVPAVPTTLPAPTSSAGDIHQSTAFATSKPQQSVEPAKRPAGRTEGGSSRLNRTVKAEAATPREEEVPAEHHEFQALPEATAASKSPVVEQPAPQPVNAGVYKSPRATAGPNALVILAIAPWGEVMLDGESVGVSPPLAELELEPGTHRIEIRNGNSRPYVDKLELTPNETIKIKHNFK